MTDVTSRISAALADRYRIQRLLGEGGMATVYPAEELRHKRNVALKVLRPELAAVLGAERFVQEITTTAGLQHPHILPLYDSGRTGTDKDGRGRTDEFLFYVMPYIQGETLREKLNRETQLAIDEAVKIATEVADALHYAHQQGVIHRDIKPENILLQNGRALVADFGIALAVSAAAGGRMTETGLSLGTPHYMSPEQATAEKDLSARSDVYSLGSVLYEMLTGDPPHTASSAQQIIMKIVTEEAAPVTKARKSVPPNVAAAVAQSLEKLPADRFQSAKEFSDALANPGFTSVTMAMAGARSAAGDPRWRNRFVAAVALAVVTFVVAVAGWVRGPTAPVPALVQFDEPLSVSRVFLRLAVAPDGRSVAVSGGDGQVLLRRLGAPGFRTLDARGYGVRFAPDGRAVVLLSPDLGVVVAPVDGGPTRTLLTGAERSLGFAWGDDGYIYVAVAGRGGIGRVPEGGGPVDTLYVAPGTHTIQDVLPRGQGVVFTTAGADAPASGTARVLRPDDGTVTDLGVSLGDRIRYSPTGHLLYAREQFVLAQPFDARRLTVTGEAVPVAEVPSGDVTFAYGGGTLVTSAGTATSNLRPALVDRTGRRRALAGLADAGYNFPEVAPDGRRIAVNVTGRDVNTGDVWVYQLPEGPLTRLTRTGTASTMSWSLDGDDIIYVDAGDAYRVRSDGSDEPTLVLDRDADLARAVLGPDGKQLFVQERPGAWDIAVATLDEPGSDSVLFADRDYWEGHPTPSPDGRWLAYYSSESGRSEVYVRPLYGPGRRHQVSREGGTRPRWSDDGAELYFWNDGWIYVAALAVGDDRAVRSVDRLLEAPGGDYDVFPGDSLFVILTPPAGADDGTTTPSPMTVTINFDGVLGGLPTRR
jgi:eukaryotic-like serine/threonine-protein kinase